MSIMGQVEINKTTESYVFDCRSQNDTEIVEDYIVTVQKSFVYCNFGKRVYKK